MDDPLYEGQILLYFPGEKAYDVKWLGFEKNVDFATAQKDSWGVVVQRPLSGPDDATNVREPPKKQTKGRPRTKRHAPAFGIFSKRRRAR